MKNPLTIILLDNTEIIINEDQVCSIHKNDHACTIYMSNGHKFDCKSPTYQEWKNDILSKPINF